MASVSTYLNFDRTTEQAFKFYEEVFGTKIEGQIMRLGDAPPTPGAPPMSDADKQLVMHVALPITAGHKLMGTDAPASMGSRLVMGTNVYINVSPDTRSEADKLFAALAEGGKVEMAMAEQFWGDYFGSLKDKFGVQWMFNTTAKS